MLIIPRKAVSIAILAGGVRPTVLGIMNFEIRDISDQVRIIWENIGAGFCMKLETVLMPAD
jgi:hypothetical protein